MVVLIIEKYRDVDAGETRQQGLRVLWDALSQAVRDVKRSMMQNLLPGQRSWGIMAGALLPLWRRRRDQNGTYRPLPMFLH